jgi:glutaredoxin-like protein
MRMDIPTSDTIIMYSTGWCPDCKRAKRVLDEHHVPYLEIDIDQDAQAMAHVKRLNRGKRIIPTIVFPDGSLLVEPSNAELIVKLGV